MNWSWPTSIVMVWSLIPLIFYVIAFENFSLSHQLLAMQKYYGVEIFHDLICVGKSRSNCTFNSQRARDGNLCVKFKIEIEFGRKFCELNFAKREKCWQQDGGGLREAVWLPFHFKTKIEFSHKLPCVPLNDMKKKCSTLSHEWSHIEIYILKCSSKSVVKHTQHIFISAHLHIGRCFFSCHTCILHTKSGLKANCVQFDWICELNLRMQCHLRIRIPITRTWSVYIYVMLRQMPSHIAGMYIFVNAMHASIHPSSKSDSRKVDWIFSCCFILFLFFISLLLLFLSFSLLCVRMCVRALVCFIVFPVMSNFKCCRLSSRWLEYFVAKHIDHRNTFKYHAQNACMV